MSAISYSMPRFQAIDLFGRPMVGARLHTYQNKTTTPAPTWRDKEQAAFNTNPIILDARGEGVVWLDPAQTYTFVLRDWFGALVWSQDNVAGVPFATDLRAPSGSDSIGFIQAGAGAIGRTSQAKQRESVSGDDHVDWRDAFQLDAPVHLIGGTYTYSGTVEFGGNTALIGERGAKIVGLTEAVTDFGLSLTGAASLADLLVEHTTTVATSGNGRANCAVVIGAQQALDDREARGWRLDNVVVQYTDTNARAGNTVAGFGDVSEGEITQLTIDTDASTGLQFHWGYGADGYTKHPRKITVQNVTINGLRTRTNGLYLSGCHDVTLRGAEVNGCSQGVIIGTGDVGEGASPDPASAGRLMGALTLDRITVHDSVNDPLLVNGASYVLGEARNPGYPNQRWIAADYGYTGLSARDFRVIRGQYAANAACSFLHFRNVEAQIYTGHSTDHQRTDTTEALTLTAICDSAFNLRSECVVAANLLSGKNLAFELAHENTDTANATQQNAVAIRGQIVNATVRDAVALGGTYIVLAAVTCDVHKGMLFEYSGQIFEFDGHARYEPGRPENNVGVRIPIKAALLAIPASATIAQYYCAHDLTLTGLIRGANKGVRIISSDARVPFDLTIDAAFENSITSDIEVPLGIRIKRHGVYYYRDDGGTMTFVNGEPAQLSVISYEETNGRRIGYANAVPQSGGLWPRGSVLWRKNPTAGNSSGWVCVTAGVGNAAVWKELPALAA